MKKLAIFTILVLICGTTSPSLVTNAYGQNDPSILLRIAVQADKQIINQLDQVYGTQIPNNIQILYDNGQKAVESLDESLSNDDVEKAKQDFLLAMNSFMQISRTISHSSQQVSQMSISEKSNNQLSNEIDRLVKYSKTLEKLSKKYDVNVESDFIKINQLVGKLQSQIDESNTNSDNVINQIKNILKSIKSDIHEAAVNQRSDRIKQLLNQLLDEIDENLKTAEMNGVDKTQIDMGHELVLEVKDLLSKNQIDDAKAAYYELKELMKNIGYPVIFR
tara:strand:+ start:1142 stop:1972 length:831 start_codon:yes stop_codon:yes gene_type:complete